MCTNERMLFICNTYMQLISAIQIKLALFDEKTADLILSDHSVNADTVAAELEKQDLFSRVRVARSKELTYEQNKFEDMMDVVRSTFDLGNKFRKMLWDDSAYGYIFYYNYDPLLICAYDLSIKRGAGPKCARFEEGVLSCLNMRDDNFVGRMKAVNKLRRLMGRDNVFDQTRDFYCYYPQLVYPGPGNLRSIPALSRNSKKLIETLNAAFGYCPDKDIYPQKYIFFASSSDIDGRPVGETELVLKIADIVGKDDLLVKMHPRDTRRIYEERGISVSRNSSIPWEVIQLNHEFGDHVFLTISSGSVMNASAMLGDEIPTYYLYPAVKGRNTELDKSCETRIGATVSRFQKMGLLKKSRLVDSADEIEIVTQ